MAVYKGQITLVNMNDGIKGEQGVGIKSSITYYAVSSNGTNPPDLEDQSLISESGILKFSEVGATFKIVKNQLYALVNNIYVPLKTGGSLISGLQGWSTEIPSVPAGFYLWIKNIVIFTDDSSTISYSVSRNGQDGQSGVSIKSVRQLYLLTDSSTIVPETPDKDSTINWQSTNPVWNNVLTQYLWICTEITYDNNKKEYTSPYTDANWKTAVNEVERLEKDYVILKEQIEILEKQADGAIESWYLNGDPNIYYNPNAQPPTNYPWYIPPTADNPNPKQDDPKNHIGDLFYDKETGFSYRFYEEEGKFIWERISDSEITDALNRIDDLKEAVDKKVAIFYSEEEPDLSKAEKDDLWIKPSGNFYQCIEIEGIKKWQLANIGIESIIIEYAESESNIIEPTTGWSTSSPEWKDGVYIWQRTVTTYKDNVKNKEYSKAICISAAAARGVIISGEQVFKSTDGVNFSPSLITLKATIQGNLSIKGWYYKKGADWISLQNLTDTCQIYSNSDAFLSGDVATIKIATNSDSYYDIISIYKVSDGKQGANGESGASASSVFLTNENITFAANAIGQVAAKATTCNIVAYTGATKVTPIIGNITGAPSGMTITKGTIIDNEIPIIIKVDANSTLGGEEEQSGTLEIPITSPVSTILKINWSKVNSGAAGANGETFYTWIRYADDEKGANMSESPQGKKYIGISNNQPNPIPSKNPNDYRWSLLQGENGVSVSSTQTFYAVSKDGTTPPINISYLCIDEDGHLSFEEESRTSFILTNGFLFSKNEEGYINKLNVKNSYIINSGAEWSENLPEVPKGYYLWTKMVFHYSDGTQNAYYSNSYHGEDGIQGPQGEKGEPGQDGENVNAYSLVARQPRILKFVQDDNTSISPGTLNLYIRKEVATNEIGYEQVRNLQLSNLKIELIDNATGVWKDLSEVMPLDQFVSINDGDITVDFQSFYNFDYEGVDEFNALTSFRNSSGSIGFTYILTEEKEIEGEIEQRVYGLLESVEFDFNNPWEIASFAQNANNITMAVQNTGLVFDATGLNVLNGGFTIYDSKEKTNRLLYIENGNLTMIGNIHANSGYFKGRIEADEGYFKGKIEADEGYFKGKIEADEGYFKGTITAAAGEIGGFKITEDSLISKGSYTTQDGAVKPLIELKGEEGKIIAQNIELGTGAKISDYIELGDGRIRLNGKKNGTEILNFLSVKASNEPNAQEILSISDNGVIKVGEGENYIVIDGGRGIMESYNYSDSRGWQITNDETIFNNVTVRGSIKSSVLEYGEIQTVGGSILIRPSSRIKKIDPSYEQDGIYYTKIWLDDATSFAESSKQTREQEEKQYCIIKNAGTVYELYARPLVDENNNVTEHSVVLVGQINSNLVNNPLVLLGKDGEVGIGINGSTIDGLLTPTSLSVFEFKKGDNSAEFLPHIILGKLPNGEKYGTAAGTYGLYAENVRLTGSLVTQLANSNQAPVYSGISTQYSGEDAPTSEAYKQYFANESFGEILIWAGAEKDTKAGIEGSKFFVDRMGNLYASSGYFNGTIITDATITASELKTARITGSGSGPALLIEDTFNGIHFNGTRDGVQKTSFEVSYSDFIVDVDSILLNKEVAIDSQGRVIMPAGYFTDGTNGTFMDGKKIGFTNSFVKDNPWSSAINSSIRYNGGIEFYGNDKSLASMKIDNDGIKANLTRFNEDVEYGVNGEIKYRPAKDGDIIIGYDLFVG